jgi:hypothetical protein
MATTDSMVQQALGDLDARLDGLARLPGRHD